MAIRVALVGTGNCGRLALIQLIEDPRFRQRIAQEPLHRSSGKPERRAHQKPEKRARQTDVPEDERKIGGRMAKRGEPREF